MANFPELQSFPEGAGNTPNCSLDVAINGYGVLTSQDADDLHQIGVHVALGPSPTMGFATVMLDAQAARGVANHLLHLAAAAELGVEAGEYHEQA